MATTLYSNSLAVTKAPKDGVSVVSITKKYLLTTTDTPPSKEENEWLDEPPVMTETNKYLWAYDIVAYSDESTSETDVTCIGVFGERGNGAVTCYLSQEGFIVPVNEYGVIAEADYLNIQVVFSLIQLFNGDYKYLTLGSTLNGAGSYTLTVVTESISYISVDSTSEGGMAYATKSSVIPTSATVAYLNLTFNFIDFGGNTGTIRKKVSIAKAQDGKTGAYTIHEWCLSDSSTIPPSSSASWDDEMPNLANTNKWLWVRKKEVPKGTNPDTISWKTPELETTLRYYLDGACFMMGNKQISLAANKILLEGSVTAAEINVEELMSNELVVTDYTDPETGTTKNGSIRSDNYYKSYYTNVNAPAGFYMDNSGYFECTQGHFKECTVEGNLESGEVHSDALYTYNGNIKTKTFKAKNVSSNPKYWALTDLQSALTTANAIVSCSGTYGNNAVSKYAKMTDSGMLYTGKGLISVIKGSDIGISANYSSYENVQTDDGTFKYKNNDAYGLKQNVLVRWYLKGATRYSANGNKYYSNVTFEALAGTTTDYGSIYPKSKISAKTDVGNGTAEVSSQAVFSLDVGESLWVTTSVTSSYGSYQVYVELQRSIYYDYGITSLGSWLYYSSAWHKMTNAYDITAISLLGVSNKYVCWNNNCYEESGTTAVQSGGYSELDSTYSTVSITKNGSTTTMTPVIVLWNTSEILFIDSSGNKLSINKSTFFNTFYFQFKFTGSNSYVKAAQLIPKSDTVNIGSEGNPWNAIYAKAIFIKVGNEWKQVTIS